jgi:hypothetical protein
MALKKTITLRDSFDEVRDIPNTYIKVHAVSGGKDQMVADVIFFKDSADGKRLKNSGYIFTPVLDGDNFIKQAYNHIKTLPDFSGAVDC